MNIRKGDTVQIISGEDNGKKGKVLVVIPSENKILVEGINIRTKHTKPKKAGETGGIQKEPVAINASKAMVVCKKCNKPTRVGHTILADGKKARVCKNCNEVISDEK